MCLRPGEVGSRRYTKVRKVILDNTAADPGLSGCDRNHSPKGVPERLDPRPGEGPEHLAYPGS